MTILRLSLALFYLTYMVSGEKTADLTTQLKEEEVPLSKELSKNEQSKIAVVGSGLRGSHSGSNALQVDEQHRATSISFRPKKEGDFGIQSNSCNILAKPNLQNKVGQYNKLRIGKVIFSKQFKGQRIAVESKVVGQARVNEPDGLQKKTVSSPLKQKPSKKEVFAHWKCQDGSCGLQVRTKGIAYKGEGLCSFMLVKPQKKVTVTVYSIGSKQLSMVCYNAQGKIIGEKNAGNIKNPGNTDLVVSRPTADIKGCSIHPIGPQTHFTRKTAVTGICTN